jgi:hypothetical protein
VRDSTRRCLFRYARRRRGEAEAGGSNAFGLREEKVTFILRTILMQIGITYR